jgi:hypothetical protein
MSRKYRISQVCGAKRRQGGFCRKPVVPGKNRCFRHGGATTRHKSEDEHHSRSLAAANAARAAMTRPHHTDGRPGGLVRAATGARLPNGRFAPNARRLPKRDRIVAKALAGVIATQKERRMAKEAALRIVPDDPSVDEPQAPAPGLGTTAIKPEAAASASGTLALPENSGEVVRTDPSQEPALPAIAAAGVPAKPRADMTKGERLSHNVDLSLEFTRQLLELPFDPENLKLLGHQKDAALTLISQQIRIESERLRAPPARGGSVEEFYRRYDGGSSERGEP